VDNIVFVDISNATAGLLPDDRRSSVLEMPIVGSDRARALWHNHGSAWGCRAGIENTPGQEERSRMKEFF
jgi:hypothetical protein